MIGPKAMILNGKYFISPDGNEKNFKDLFKELITAGVGRPVYEDGFPSNPWTAERLADAISQIKENDDGIELRTVQLWFQDNDSGISQQNIRWLARIFGCDDPVATRQWQRKLHQSRELLIKERQEQKKKMAETSNHFGAPISIGNSEILMEQLYSKDGLKNSSISKIIDRIFTDPSRLNLPFAAFAGAVILGFLAYLFQVYDITFNDKQVGYFWAPNWTLLILAIIPLYFWCVVDLFTFWKFEGRKQLTSHIGPNSIPTLASRLQSASPSFWTLFLICLIVVFGFQWMDFCLFPILTNDPDGRAIDWGLASLALPEQISSIETIIFTLLTFLYLGLITFLYFTGLIVIYLMLQDFWEVRTSKRQEINSKKLETIDEIESKIIYSIFRLSTLGIFVATLIKLQSHFLNRDISGNIYSWLFNDFFQTFHDGLDHQQSLGLSFHFSSFIIGLGTCTVFVTGLLRIYQADSRRHGTQKASKKRFAIFAIGVIMFLILNYLLIGAFIGHSIFMLIAVILVIYVLLNPKLI